MGLISIGGIGSGLDVKGIVDALVEAERAPKNNSLDRFESSITVALTGLGGLKGSLDELHTAAFDLSLPSSFSKRTVTISDTDFFTATSTSSASTGNYDVEVETLAQGSIHQSKVFTGGSSTTFGDGTLTFTVDTETFDVDVSATDSLSDIREKINAESGNTLVSVNLLNDVFNGVDTGSVLTFDSTTTGTTNDLVVTYSGDASLADLSTGLNSIQSAGDASIKVDGFTATNSTNKFANIIEGITIDIKKEHSPSGTTDSLKVALDTDSTKNLITAFVETYNSFIEVTNQLGSADSTAPGLLLGDYTLRQASSQIKNLFSTPVSAVSGNFNSLSSIGISTTKEGTLEVDNAVLDSAIANDFDKLDDLFTGDEGFATQLRDLISNYTGSSGIITQRENSLNSQLSQIADDRIALGVRIEKLQFRLTTQFATMDATVAQMNSTQSYIAQQFENLPGFGGKK